MKRLLSVLMVMAMIFALLPTNVFASTDVTQVETNGNYTYMVYANTATITKYAGTETAVTIPAVFGVYPVTAIGDSAFSMCITITSVVIPASVITIGKLAFSYCLGLESVTFGTGVTTIGESAFFGCVKLATVLVPNNVTTINDFAFRGCTGLTSVSIGSGVTAIGSNVFSEDIQLNEVYFWGNAPTMGTDSLGLNLNYKVYYFTGKTGFADTWNGHTAAAFPVVPITPKVDSATANSIVISWTPSTGPITGYMVYRYNPATSAYTRVKVTSSPTFTDTTGLTLGETYFYKIKSYLKIDADATIYYSASTAPLSAMTLLATPVSPKAVPASFNSITISWGAVANAKGYMVYRYNPATLVYNRVAVTASTSYTDKGLATGTNYYYKVKAYIKIGEAYSYSAATAGVSAKPTIASPALTIALKATSTSSRIVWSSVSGATGYVLYELNPTTTLYDRVKVTKKTEFTKTGLSAGIHTFKVRAYMAVNGVNVYGNPTPAFSVTL